MRRDRWQSGLSARRWLNRSLLILLAAASLFAASLNARWLLAEAYATYARENLNRARAGETALAAAGLAQRLQPDNSGYLSLLGRAERRYGSGQVAEAHYRDALKRAPSDAGVWRDFALLQVAEQDHGAQLEHALERAQTLNPTSRNLHLVLGLTGLSTWSSASPALRRLWSRSVTFRLRHGRKEFLRYVFASGREATLCQNFELDAALRDWCYWTKNARHTCYASGLSPKQLRACERLGAFIGRGQ